MKRKCLRGAFTLGVIAVCTLGMAGCSSSEPAQVNKSMSISTSLRSPEAQDEPVKGSGHLQGQEAIRGREYSLKGDYDRAIAEYTEAIRKNPNHTILYVFRGSAYSNKGDYDKAIADFNEALRVNPNYADAYNGRGTAYSGKGDYDRAIADYNEALRLDPNNADAKNNIDELRSERGW